MQGYFCVLKTRLIMTGSTIYNGFWFTSLRWLLSFFFFLLKTFPPKLVLLDFSDIDRMEEVITEISECYGYVDVLICNSSMKVKAAVQNLSLDMDKTIMDVNFFGPITLAKGISVRTLIPF